MNIVLSPDSDPARTRLASGFAGARTALFAGASLLAAAGLWLLAADLLRPGPIGFPSEGTKLAETTVADARLAARIGMVRGDLWAEAAFAGASVVAGTDRPAPTDRSTSNERAIARDDMETSLLLAPLDARGWLLLAMLPAASRMDDPRVASLLKMAYFTAPNDLTLAVRRVARAASSNALSDPEIQDLVKSDLRHILAGTEQQRGAIVASYRAASPDNRARLEAMVDTLDSGFARMLQGDRPR